MRNIESEAATCAAAMNCFLRIVEWCFIFAGVVEHVGRMRGSLRLDSASLSVLQCECHKLDLDIFLRVL